MVGGTGSQALRIIRLIRDVQREPFSGDGKPEPLKHELKGCWSRRIDREHRLVYQVQQDKIRILALPVSLLIGVTRLHARPCLF